MDFHIQSRIIYEVVTGSRAYGTDGPGSDLDIRGIAIPPRKYFFGFDQRFEKASGPELGSDDAMIFDIRRFFKLAASGNPNMLEQLWVPERCIRLTSPWGERIRAQRELFLTRRTYEAFAQYGRDQMHRLKEQLHAKPGDCLVGLQNAARAELVARHGYDTKGAAHVVRILRMAQELLTAGELNVERKDREELLRIRNGAWSYMQLKGWVEDATARMREAAAFCRLPATADMNRLTGLCDEIVAEFLALHP